MTKGTEFKNKIHPNILADIVNDSLNLGISDQLLRLKGRYMYGKSDNYYGFYYDKIHDETKDCSITVKTPEEVRKKLENNKIYSFDGTVTHKLEKYRKDEIIIKIIFVVQDVRLEKPFLKTDTIKKMEIAYQKELKPPVQLNELLTRKLKNKKKPRILFVLGTAAITGTDVKESMAEYWDSFYIKEERVSFYDKKAIIELLKNYDNRDFDFIALIRGGGVGLEIFNDTEIAETAVNMKTPLITAIGHAEDHSFLDKISSKVFITPTALGNYLKEVCKEGFKDKLISTLTESKEDGMAELKELKTEVREKNKQINELKDKNNNLSAVQRIKPYKIGIIILSSLALGILLGSIVNRSPFNKKTPQSQVKKTTPKAKSHVKKIKK